MTLKSFLNAFKILKQKLQLQKSSETDASNYKIILTLPLSSKVFKIVLLDQTNEFSHLTHFLYDYQPDFGENHSADRCI